MAGEDLDYIEEEKEVFKFSYESTAKPFEVKTKSQGKLCLLDLKKNLFLFFKKIISFIRNLDQPIFKTETNLPKQLVKRDIESRITNDTSKTLTDEDKSKSFFVLIFVNGN